MSYENSHRNLGNGVTTCRKSPSGCWPKKRKRFHGCPMTIAPRLGTWSDTSMNMNVALTLPDYWEITFAWRKSILKLDINGLFNLKVSDWQFTLERPTTYGQWTPNVSFGEPANPHCERSCVGHAPHSDDDTSMFLEQTSFDYWNQQSASFPRFVGYEIATFASNHQHPDVLMTLIS